MDQNFRIRCDRLAHLQIQLTDTLAAAGGTVAPVSILGSYQVCNAFVHITDGLLWPSFSADSATLPVTMPMAMPYIPSNWYVPPMQQLPVMSNGLPAVIPWQDLLMMNFA